MAMVLQFLKGTPIDHSPDVHQLTPIRALALGRMTVQPQRRARIPLHLLPTCTTLNALAKKGMGAEIIAMRTGLSVEGARAFLDGWTDHQPSRDAERL